jgi:hypothetical protein
MTAATPSERVADILVNSGYRRISAPLQVAGLTFDVAAAFVGVGHSADLVVIGDMAADGERKVLQQVEGIARALDVVRSHRPLTIVIVGPRPVGKTLEALAQVGRILPVEEAVDSGDLRDRLAILLPLKLPATLMARPYRSPTIRLPPICWRCRSLAKRRSKPAFIQPLTQSLRRRPRRPRTRPNDSP